MCLLYFVFFSCLDFVAELCACKNAKVKEIFVRRHLDISDQRKVKYLCGGVSKIFHLCSDQPEVKYLCGGIWIFLIR